MPRNARPQPVEDPNLMRLIRAIVGNHASEVSRLIELDAVLARQPLRHGATRQSETEFFFEEIKHYFYAGDTPLHAAAAGYRVAIARNLIGKGADVMAANRRGAEPLHYAADGGPGSPHWNPDAQAGMIELLVNAGADPNALDKSGVAPLHRAVRQRCVGAVEALIRKRADVRKRNKSGSTPLHLAVQDTGKGGAGSPASRTLQLEIIRMLLKAGADPKDRDGKGKSVRQCARGAQVLALL